MSLCRTSSGSRLEDVGPPSHCASLYVHLPFCRDRCTYCAFPTVLDRERDHAPLVAAILHEQARIPQVGPLKTLYLGGGTPSLVSPRLLQRIVRSTRSRFGMLPAAEITLETNPGQVTPYALSSWADLGVTRLSVGIQTFDDALLRQLGRHDSSLTARSALDAIVRRWGSTWSADLIVGWGRKGVADLERDLHIILSFNPPHISIYGLTLEPGTTLFEQHRTTRKEAVSSDELADLDMRWSEVLEAAGYARYEVSNWALTGHLSQHNQVYWKNESYLGLGPGAASSLGSLRWVNRPTLRSYLTSLEMGCSARDRVERLTPAQRLLESLATGLRTRQGVSLIELDRRFGSGWRDCVALPLSTLLRDGALTITEDRLVISRADFTRADAVIRALTTDLASAASFGRPVKSVQT